METDPRPTIVVSANSFWNIANFRTSLIDQLVSRGSRVIVAVPDADQAWAKQHGVEAVSLAIERSGLNPFRDARLMLEYRRLFRLYRPSFYLGFTAKPNIYGSIAARGAGVASIPNVSGLGTAFIRGGLLGSFLTLLYGIAFRKCPIVMFQNPDDRQLFISRGLVRQEQARLLPGSGIDLDHFRPAQMAHGAPIFLFIGRLLGDKGVREYVEAARVLKAHHPDWRFQLLGELDEGNRTGVTVQELRSWTGEGVVEHLGHADDVRPHISEATAVVLPSYREGLPRSLLEAAAMARPLVATDVPGNRQLVVDGENGLLCAAQDPTGLANVMSRIGNMDPSALAAMGLRGRQLAEEGFNQDRVIAAYLDAMAEHAPANGNGS